jgi:SAM-dependent methyltransferase
MRETFEQIYEMDLWGGGSGEGSFPVHTRGYVRFLEAFIRRNRIRSVVDLGCGDWQFSRFVDWQGARYDGFDIVPKVVERNQREFSSETVNFHLFDGDFSRFPDADLFLAKDVLQHWSDSEIVEFLPELRRFPIALLTNCVNPHGETTHSDIADGDFRYLDLRASPYNLVAEHVYTFTNSEKSWWNPFLKPRWRKNVLLVRGARPA